MPLERHDMGQAPSIELSGRSTTTVMPLAKPNVPCR